MKTNFIMHLVFSSQENQSEPLIYVCESSDEDGELDDDEKETTCHPDRDPTFNRYLEENPMADVVSDSEEGY